MIGLGTSEGGVSVTFNKEVHGVVSAEYVIRSHPITSA